MKTKFNCVTREMDFLQVGRSVDEVFFEVFENSKGEAMVILTIADVKRLRKTLKKLIEEVEE